VVGKEQFHYLYVALFCGYRERSPFKRILHVDVGMVFQQDLAHGIIVVFDSPVQSSESALVKLVDHVLAKKLNPQLFDSAENNIYRFRIILLKQVSYHLEPLNSFL